MPLTMSKKWEGERENREEKKKHMPSQVQQKKNIYIYTHTHLQIQKEVHSVSVCICQNHSLINLTQHYSSCSSFYLLNAAFVCMYVHTTEVIVCYARVATLAVRHTCARLFISDSNESERARTP